MEKSWNGTVSQLSGSTGDMTRLRTWQLFGLLVVASAVLAWAENEFVMTPEVYRNILGSQLDALRQRIQGLFFFFSLNLGNGEVVKSVHVGPINLQRLLVRADRLVSPAKLV